MRTLVVSLLMALLGQGRALALDVTTCGTTVPAGVVATLATDLTCPGVGITLGRRSSLELAGYRLQADGVVVQCTEGKCTIVGPGEIVGAGSDICIFGPYPGKLTVTTRGLGTLDVHDCDYGIYGGGPVRVEDVTVHGSVIGVWVNGSAKVLRVDASSNVFDGLVARPLSGRQVTANGNGRFGIVGGPLKGKVKLSDVVATGNGDAGVIGFRVALENATITGNDGYGLGIDVASHHAPHLEAVVCSESGHIVGHFIDGDDVPPLNGTWSVCAAD